MPVDQYSPVAPARIRVLLVPVGRIKRSRFAAFAGRLEPQSIVRLGDITPDPRPDRTMFSPLSNPNGKILYNFTTSAPPPSYLALSPFELYREPLMILGIADGKEYESPRAVEEGSAATEHDESADQEREAIRSELKPIVEVLREQYPKALVHNLLIFDSSFESPQPWHPEGTIQVPPPERSKVTALKTLMCDLSAVLLAEMATLSKSLQALPEFHLSAPGPQGSTARAPYGLERTFSSGMFSPLGEDSRSSTPTQMDSPRFSMPPPQHHTSRTPTPTLQENNGSATASGVTNGAPTGDNGEATTENKPQASNRFSIQGFGSGSSAERAKMKEAAQHLVIGANVMLMAGKLKETIRDLETAAMKSKDAGDNGFLAKALEMMLVCFLLCCEQGVPFEIPAICFSGLRTTSLEGNLPALLELVPRLCETITSYYRRTLPTLPFAEWSLRYMRLIMIVVLLNLKGTPENTGEALAGFLDNLFANLEEPKFGKSTKEIAETLLRGMQPILETNNSVEDVERLQLLAETARCLSVLGFARKQALVEKILIDSLVPALVKARKAGAAEAGIHPAASLVGIGAQGLSKAMSADDNTLFLDHLGNLYGIAIRADGHSQTHGPIQYFKTNGSFPLKCDVLRSCINVCEAMAEFKGVLSFTATLLHLGGPGIPVNPSDPRFRSLLIKDEQIRLAGNIIRTVDAAHHAGFGELVAEYWDDFLVRDMSPSRVQGDRFLVSHQMSDIDASIEAEHKHGPFLHNAFASKANNDIPETPVVVGELAELFVTLQNPFEFDVEIESLKLVFDGKDTVEPLPFKALLRARGLQKYLVEWIPTKVGSLLLTGCSIKVRGCRERLFQVYSEVPELPEESNVKPKVPTVASSAGSGPTAVTMATHVVEKQPSVAMEMSLKQSALSLMEGQTKVFTVRLEHQSERVPVGFIRMSLQNTVTDALEKRMSNKKLALTDWHYLDAERRNSVWRCSSGDEILKSQATGSFGAVAVFDIQVKGTRDLTGGTVILDYASSTPPPKLKDRYITSRVSKAVDVSVEPSVIMTELQVVAGKDVPSYVKLAFPDESPSDFFIVFCRYRNDSSKTMSVSMKPFQPSTDPSTNSAVAPGEATDNGGAKHDVSIHPEELIIQPGQNRMCRQIIRRIYLPRSQQPVPEAPSRQYIFDGSVRSALEEQQGREMFWYRMELLHGLRATWTEVTSALSGRASGEVNEPTVTVTPEMVAAMKHERVLLTAKVANVDGESILQDGPASYRVARNSRVRVEIQATNPEGHPIRGTVRLKPKFDDPMVDVPDIRKQLDRRVPSFVLEPDATITKATEFWAMVVGVSMMLDVVFYEEGNVMRTYKSASCMISFF